MALKNVVLATLLVVSLVSADAVKGQQLGGTELVVVDSGSKDDDGGSGSNWVSPKSECAESKLYTGPCVELICAAACLLQTHKGGHCKGSLIWGQCLCFACS